MSYANTNKIQAAMIALEQEKVFDRVEWNFLFKALQKILINQVMLSKIWCLAYVEKGPADIIQNIRKDTYDFL